MRQARPLDGTLLIRLLPIAAAALLLRITVRLVSGEADFWENGYTFLFDLARSVAAGHGLTLDGHTPTVYRVPGYPLFLAAVTRGHQAFYSLVVAQSLVGALTVLCAGLLAAEWFGSRAALIASAFAAIYPYYVVHDTALQDTGLFTLVTLVSVLLLIRARRSISGQEPPRRTQRFNPVVKAALPLLAGLALAAAVLTRASIAPFALVAPLWLGWAADAGTPARARVHAGLLCAAALVVGVAPWLIRSKIVAGAPILQNDTGQRLWDGNNPYTFTRYPIESIDLSKADALEAMPATERAELAAAGADDVSFDRWFLHQAVRFMREHPWLTVANGFRKIGATFSILPSPRRSLWPTLAYALSYGPIMILGLVGMVSGWRSWREHSLVYWLFLSFALLTALFFGHTSHRAFLDVYWMAYAASVISPRSFSR
jgi:4-amino-4-deoxy-L-arabinose transferase-like glycosyltransferase